MIDKWDRRFLDLAQHIAGWSKEPSSRVGAVVVGPEHREIRATGYNGFPRGVADDHRLHARPAKHPLIVHAEENAIAHAARIGVSLLGCIIYVWPYPPCTRCARSIIQAGIVRVVAVGSLEHERWGDEFFIARAMLAEAGVNLEMG